MSMKKVGNPVSNIQICLDIFLVTYLGLESLALSTWLISFQFWTLV